MKCVKKITAFLLVLALITSLAACGRKETEQLPTDSKQPEISGKIEPIEVPEEKTEEPLPEVEAEKHESDETSEDEPEEAEKNIYGRADHLLFSALLLQQQNGNQ